MTSEQYAFDIEVLEDYSFELNQELNCGYDQQGHRREGEELVEMRSRGLIIKESIHKTVFYRKTLSLLGFIEEAFDGTWWAYSPYYPSKMADMDVFGFSSEFYAVRYLHQIARAEYPDAVGEVACLPWE